VDNEYSFEVGGKKKTEEKNQEKTMIKIIQAKK